MIDILVVDDDLGEFQPGLQHALREYRLHFAYTGRDALAILEKQPEIALVLLDIKMPPDFAEVEGREGIEVLKRVKQARPGLPVIMLTVLNEVDLIVEAIQAGAFHYIVKPFDRDRLRAEVKRATENAGLRQQVQTMTRARDAMLKMHTGKRGRARNGFHGMIGSHPLMQQLYDQIEQAARFEDMNIVLLGESGAGKELAARAIHACSSRAKKPFVAINCGSISETVLQSELFGHVKGSFTNAESDRQGAFQLADTGTIFLDEIGEMSPAMQTAVLRVIENNEIRPVGSDKTVKVDVRIVCATNRDLTAAKEAGDFRPDLYYRIWDIPLTVPALRYRKSDIPALVKHFAAAAGKENNIRCEFAPEAVDAMCEHDWPGNVRQLASMTRRLMVFAKEGTVTELQVRGLLGLSLKAEADPAGAADDADAPPAVETAAEPETVDLDDDLPEIRDLTEFCRAHGELQLKNTLVRAIREAGNSRGAMALLGMPDDRYDAFRKWLQRLDIKVRELT